MHFLLPLQVKDGLVLPDKASLYLTAIEDADYKDEKIECEIEHFHVLSLMDIGLLLYLACTSHGLFWLHRSLLMG